MDIQAEKSTHRICVIKGRIVFDKICQFIKDLFADLIMLIKMMIFCSVTVLTPGYITLHKNKRFVYNKRLDVINDGAGITIDISKSNIRKELGIYSLNDYFDKTDLMKSYLKKCPIKIYGICKDKEIFFSNGSFSYGGDEVFLDFYLNTNSYEIKHIDKIIIKSACEITDVKIAWHNCGK